MQIVTLDFESYFDQEYSLRRMSTEEYVRDPRFEIMGVSAKVGDGVTQWCSGDAKALRSFLCSLGLQHAAVLSHNAAFDGLILAHHFSVYPARYLDTMLMANASIKPETGRVSLDACLKHTGLGVKGDTVHNMAGRHRQSLSVAEMRAYGEYCKNDTETTYALFKHLVKDFPRSELKIIDLTLRMYLQPTLGLDTKLLAEHLQDVVAKKEAAQARVRSTLSQDVLMSNNKFGEILKKLGVEPPMKTSLTTGKRVYAFAKNDMAFKEFAEEYEDDPLVGPILMARLATKSTLEETRTSRLLGIGRLGWLLRVPLAYYSAHTGRYGGSGGINLQNLPQPHKSRIRFALTAPAGHVLLGADLSQIEARICAVLSGARGLADAFRRGVDVYADFGSRLYGRTITRADKRERFLAKTAVLGLQYGMGADKFISTCRAQGDVKVTHSESQKVVDTYRAAYPEIPRMWRRLNELLERMSMGAHGQFECLEYSRFAIKRPNGMSLRYENLEWNGDNYAYTYGPMIRTLWGGKLLENIIQSLARDVVMEQMLRVHDELGLRPCLQVHDELVYVVPADKSEEYSQAIRKIMTAPPTWMPDAPIDVEIHTGANFGELK